MTEIVADTVPDLPPMEPRLAELISAKRRRRGGGRYIPLTAGEVAERLVVLLAANDESRRATNVRRMGGGASKEQFLFDLDGDGPAERLVLRMDPLEGIVETCRGREAQVLAAVRGVVPVAPVAFVDARGAAMGQPAMVTQFVDGVTKPTDVGGGPSGVGIILGERVGTALAPQYVGNLAAIHAVDLDRCDLPDFAIPSAGTTQAAEWQLNYWVQMRAVDLVDASPLLAYAETWLRARLPICETPVLLHGDYRLGNFMFDETTLRMTAILDWELSHVGDFHEDIAYSLEPLFCSRDADGGRLIAAMMPVDAFLDGYRKASGRTIDPATLHWYRVLNSYKLVVMNVASGPLAARDGTNHQSALLGFLAACAVDLSETLCRLLAGEEP